MAKAKPFAGKMKLSGKAAKSGAKPPKGKKAPKFPPFKKKK